MARLAVKIPRRLAWAASDVLEVHIGSENAASLAASTPSGGSKVAELPAWGDEFVRGGFGGGGFGGGSFGFASGGYGFGMGEFGYGEFGLHDAPRAVIEFDYSSSDKCATLPVGVKVRDACGNVSDVFETVVQLHDPPRGARNLQVAATASPLQARLTWDKSPDVG